MSCMRCTFAAYADQLRPLAKAQRSVMSTEDNASMAMTTAGYRSSCSDCVHTAGPASKAYGGAAAGTPLFGDARCRWQVHIQTDWPPYPSMFTTGSAVKFLLHLLLS